MVEEKDKPEHMVWYDSLTDDERAQILEGELAVNKHMPVKHEAFVKMCYKVMMAEAKGKFKKSFRNAEKVGMAVMKKERGNE